MLIRQLHWRELAGCALALLIASGAWAQEVKSSTQPPSDAGLLAGPPVEDEATVQSGGRQGLVPGARRQQESLPIRVWVNAVRDLGLSAEQQARVQAIVSEFQTAQRRYQHDHGEQMRALQQQARQARADGREPEPAVREALQKLESENPKPLDAQRRIWAVLDESQQAGMRERLAELEKQGQQRRLAGEAAPNSGTGTSSPQSATSDQAMTGAGATSQRPDSGAMRDSDDGMMSGGEASSSGNAPPMRDGGRERSRERRRAAANAPGGMDDNARRRVAFLEQHQAAGRAGNAPSPEERTFKFTEDDE